MKSVISLEDAWVLVESMNNNANQQSKDLWLSGDIYKAIQYQSICFRKIFLELDNTHRQLIQHWAKQDDEFQDYFKCLFDEEEYINYFS